MARINYKADIETLAAPAESYFESRPAYASSNPRYFLGYCAVAILRPFYDLLSSESGYHGFAVAFEGDSHLNSDSDIPLDSNLYEEIPTILQMVLTETPKDELTKTEIAVRDFILIPDWLTSLRQTALANRDKKWWVIRSLIQEHRYSILESMILVHAWYIASRPASKPEIQVSSESLALRQKWHEQRAEIDQRIDTLAREIQLLRTSREELDSRFALLISSEESRANART